MHWGYYCRTCGVSSSGFYKSPAEARQDLCAVGEVTAAMTADEDVTLPTVRIPVVTFLSEHSGHELWAECSQGVLKLTSGLPPIRRQQPPRCVDDADAEPSLDPA